VSAEKNKNENFYRVEKGQALLQTLVCVSGCAVCKCACSLLGCLYTKSAFADAILPSLNVKSNIPLIFPSGNSPVNSTSIWAELSVMMSNLITENPAWL